MVYRSYMERIDQAFEEEILEQEIFPGIKDYREQNNNGFLFFDLRIGYLLVPARRVSLICKNIFNEEIMGRSGDIQSP